MTVNTQYTSIKLLVDQQVILTAITTPAGGSVTWSSSDEDVAIVNSTGKVTAIDTGSCFITATISGKTEKVFIEVVAEPEKIIITAGDPY